MAGYLNFDPNRKLEFDSARSLEFDTSRPLDFQPARELEFQPNRDLGFGRRGVVFRGYICPICGALVSPDSTSCNECGTVFEGAPSPARTTLPAAPPAAPVAGRSPAAAAPKKSLPPAKPGVAYCAYCGVQLHAGDAFCWNCGTKATGGSSLIRLPKKKQEPATREWRPSQER